MIAPPPFREVPPLVAAESLPVHASVLLYGAGNVGRDLLRVLRASGADVRAFLDRRAAPGQAVDGSPVLHPGSGSLAPSERKLPVVLSLFNRGIDVPALASELQRLGFESIVSFVDIHSRFPRELGDRFWLTGREIYEREAGTIAEAEGLFADEASRAFYRGMVWFRRTGDYSRLAPQQDVAIQYVPTDVPGWPPPGPLRLIDCGAYDGDTIESLHAGGLRIEAAAAFEPEAASFLALAAKVRSWPLERRTDLALWPCGVGAATGLVSFQTGNGESSRVSADGGGTISVVALDDVLSGFRPTLVKMDIEGAEPGALEGMKGIAREFRPALAVCVYHCPDHLWEIPRLIDGWGLGYRFFLRGHSEDGFDWVLYAVPA